jgi:hypothetical protein
MCRMLRSDIDAIFGVRHRSRRFRIELCAKENEMRWLGGLLLVLLPVSSAAAGSPRLEAGAYQISYRLELPHVERWAVERTGSACLAGAPVVGRSHLPILSANLPFKACTIKALRSTGKVLDYDIVCPGRGAAKARASYTLSNGGFQARIFMTMGGKNMTMTEVQRGRLIGTCTVASSH